ncbi:MAG TPA: acyl-CoA desaturase [Chitinophagaceae bacterium]|nr:acyl-CoA desaturase [Chitinophagaceae bacterium]
MTKIKFKSGSSSLFFQSLDREIRQLLTGTGLLAKAKRTLWIKMVFYFLLHASSYLVLFLAHPVGIPALILTYLFIGISGLLLGFNVSHDALHGSFSKNKKINHWLYHVSFNVQGINAYLWKIRHQSSHHIFPNVDGCDADIDDNPFIRLSPQHRLRKYQRYQHLYSFLVYCFYTLHWLLFKDALYLFKKNVANLQKKKHSLKQKILFFAWKIAYLFILLILPVLTGYSFTEVLLCFFIMHVVNSLCFIHFLIATHLCMETLFPETDENGFLPDDFYTHQLATSLDYAPSSRIFNWFLGGFNAHAAHHLYPKLPHTVYPYISGLIEQKAKEFNMPYHKLNLAEAIHSHYRYLKMMGQPQKKSSAVLSLAVVPLVLSAQNDPVPHRPERMPGRSARNIAWFRHCCATRINGVAAGLLTSCRDLKGIQAGLWNKSGKRGLPFINRGA